MKKRRIKVQGRGGCSKLIGVQGENHHIEVGEMSDFLEIEVMEQS